MEIIEGVRYFKKILGGTRNGLVSRLFIIASLSIQANELFSMYINWNVFVKRLLAFKEFNSALFGMLVCAALDDISSLCSMAEKNLQNYRNQNLAITSKCTKNMADSSQKSVDITSKFTKNMADTSQKTDITSKCLENMTNIDQNLKWIIVGLITFASGLPIIFACLITIFKDHNTINMDKMPFIIYLYYPEGFKSLKIYFASLFLQLFIYVVIMSYIYCASAAFSLASISLCTQMQLICQSLFEAGTTGKAVEYATVGTTERDELMEVSQLKQIVKEHQDVFNNFLELNKRSKFIVSAFINILTIQMCCYIFFVIELESISAKIKYLGTLFLVFSMMFYFSTVGQRLTDEIVNCTYSYFNLISNSK